jgi:hypothetical protein
LKQLPLSTLCFHCDALAWLGTTPEEAQKNGFTREQQS